MVPAPEVACGDTVRNPTEAVLVAAIVHALVIGGMILSLSPDIVSSCWSTPLGSAEGT